MLFMHVINNSLKMRQHKCASHSIIYARVAQMKFCHIYIWIYLHGKVGKKLLFGEILTDLS